MSVFPQCYHCDKTVDQPGYTVRCQNCHQFVDHHQAEVIKTNHGSGRGWRCSRCGAVADEVLIALLARDQEVSR